MNHQFAIACLTILGLTWASLITALGNDHPDKTGRSGDILKRFLAEFVQLTPGQGQFAASFLMGSDRDVPPGEKPAHKVTFAYNFDMARYEVTQELYEVVMGGNPSKWRGPRNSADKVTWTEARDFCLKVTAELQRRQLLPKNEEIRLPSEAEWEYACRAGTTTAYSFGDRLEDLTHYCWFKGNSKGFDPPVGQKKPNPWGLYDMHGYIWEWCADAWQADYRGAPSDGSAWVSPESKERVLRGGSWADQADSARSAFRHHRPIDVRSDAIGFRCLRAKVKG